MAKNAVLLLLFASATAALRVPALLISRRATLGLAAAAVATPERATAADGSVFVGSYTDPMHPGGTRTISLQNTKVGGFQLAKIVGGGGVGEPESFELPAMVNGASITIDFSPKGGPKDFTGYWDEDGIKFPPTPRQIERGNTAGNKWPKTK
mmetsp:Transcript_12630/g.32032  ORF Transcript_12630/g.32032 Transcript_12630/m.32032 type:complete len:152 (-) Transcript_12630:788-1243(-)